MNEHKDIHKHNHYSEQITVFLSVLCTIHCVLTPILVIVLPTVGNYFEQYHWVEYVIIVSVFILGTSSILHGYKEHHHYKAPAFIFFFGLILMVSASLLKIVFQLNHTSSHFISGLGGILAGIGQLYNLKLINSAKK
ncbi:MAG TPA: MerC domain-containing protein [Chitinophagales bacterium]|mgnify:CR=1 FL=1|jgi:hypothetical protein|nr:MerC domain-containing protein [Chitinophagales bacterium]MBP6154347.1 MerC domain-containing protein [Chitinophagales bacterium]HQV77291.1 MerC domain-containing protein [Chitinophagales bacterium]HQW78352.1 MerC domain-containing protein [Chitinophagales bacterium]HRB19329.1 MerC domain-containing protein [Chitinophagales bacterium]